MSTGPREVKHWAARKGTNREFGVVMEWDKPKQFVALHHATGKVENCATLEEARSWLNKIEAEGR